LKNRPVSGRTELLLTYNRVFLSLVVLLFLSFSMKTVWLYLLA